MVCKQCSEMGCRCLGEGEVICAELPHYIIRFNKKIQEQRIKQEGSKSFALLPQQSLLQLDCFRKVLITL